jgi:hypothetical protein
MKKILLLFVALIVLGGCNPKENGRYECIIRDDMLVGILDTQTGILYFGNGNFKNFITGEVGQAKPKKKADE